MIKKVAIISLSSGILGEPFVRHEVKIGMKRLHDYGLEVVTTENALKGMTYLSEHPESKAEDLLNALKDKSVDMILCAIGGDDTYRLLPYLFENDELKNAVKDNKKIFLGYSDTTINHFMLHKAGLHTFYGQAFLPDICELDNEMLPYTRKYFEELIRTGTIREIRPSEYWYEERKSFDESQIGVPKNKYTNSGFELLQGSATFNGQILGGCIESIYDMFDNSRYSDTADLCKKYNLFPPLDDWTNKILLLESSEEKAPPALYKKMLIKLKETGIFSVIKGIIIGKPMDEVYYNDYKKILIEIVEDSNLSIVYNVNIGHSSPKCIIPFGVTAYVDTREQVIRFESDR
ncbi:LD-carboxypeptidase [Treponema socranskii]|uniref:S66 family peptidase n=1 Tax=Treponema socranskii TaxID=53419 RepID=UPI003D903584